MLDKMKYLPKVDKKEVIIIQKSLKDEEDLHLLDLLLKNTINLDIIRLVLFYNKNLELYSNLFFNNEEIKLIQNINNILNLQIDINEENSYEDYRNMIVLISQSYKVLIAILIIRLFNMNKLKKEDFEGKVTYGKDTLYLYAPIAHRLGIGNIKSELEELSLYFIDLTNYKKVSTYLDIKKEQREKNNKEAINNIDKNLKKKIKGYKIFGRSKSIYSIYKKTINLNKSFSEIYDFQGIRIICKTKEDCYTALGVIHDIYDPLPNRFKDYIALKKPNLYQSLHTTVVDANGLVYEVQIRTYEMDEISECGIAAHWLYKDSSKKSLGDVEEQLHLFREIIQNNKLDSTDLDKDIFEATIYTFTPSRKIIMLPSNSTVIDFAFKVHSSIGSNMVNAIVNDKIVNFSTVLKNGDQVNIITKEGAQSPQKEWLDIVVTKHAKKKIKSFINNKKQIVELKKEEEGLKKLKKAIHSQKIQVDIIDNDDIQRQVLENLHIKSLSTLCKEFYLNNISVKDINMSLVQKEIHLKKKVNQSKTKSVYVLGIDNIKIKLSKCCKPIYGDDIIGVIKTGESILVHKSGCLNISDSNLIDVFWSENNSNYYLTMLTIEAIDRGQLLNDIMSIFSSQKIQLGDVSSKVRNDLVYASIEAYVKDKEQLEKVKNTLKNVENILSVN